VATFSVNATSVSFRLLLDGAELAQQAQVTVRHIPLGNDNVIDLGGLEAATFKCRAQLSSFADLRTLQGLCGQTGTLDYTEATYTTAVLRSATRGKVTGRDDVQFVTLDFVIGDET